MVDTRIFEEFLDTSGGREIAASFRKEKETIEDPGNFVISKMKGKIKPKNYLDIGGGLGNITLEIMKGLGCEQVDFLEPSTGASEHFSHLAKLSGIKFSTINSGFEDFVPDKKYDFITAIHSWYYIKLEALKKLYDILEKGGHACIFLDSKNDIVKKIQDICQQDMHDILANNSEDIADYLGQINIPYTIYENDKILSGLLDDKELTERAKIMISYLSYIGWDKVSVTTKEKVRKLLIEEGKGKDKYPSRRRLIIIKKQYPLPSCNPAQRLQRTTAARS